MYKYSFGQHIRPYLIKRPVILSAVMAALVFGCVADAEPDTQPTPVESRPIEAAICESPYDCDPANEFDTIPLIDTPSVQDEFDGTGSEPQPSEQRPSEASAIHGQPRVISSSRPSPIIVQNTALKVSKLRVDGRMAYRYLSDELLLVTQSNDELENVTNRYNLIVLDTLDLSERTRVHRLLVERPNLDENDIQERLHSLMDVDRISQLVASDWSIMSNLAISLHAQTAGHQLMLHPVITPAFNFASSYEAARGAGDDGLLAHGRRGRDVVGQEHLRPVRPGRRR